MQIGFIGLGKLGLPVAELFQQKGFSCTGYDTTAKQSPYINIVDTIDLAITDKDIVFVAVPTPHSKGYGGQMPIADLEPEDFNYSAVKKVLTKCNELMNKIKEDMKDIGKIELHPKFDGKQMIMVIQPL